MVFDTEGFFEDVLRQNGPQLKKRFRDDAVIRWHCTGEEFSPEEYIRANCEYPGSWSGEIERVEESGDCIVMAARVFMTDHPGSYHVVSFITQSEGKILTLDEYWADDGEPPEWRRNMNIGKPLRQQRT
ncbi:MAG: nuclear transport factor 2 family protein [Oscillospiraceae bacterium]|nr:nuclear transport factor 2 family protein [Oscillospiraceae bacterium]